MDFYNSQSDWSKEFDRDWKKAQRRSKAIWIAVIVLMLLSVAGRFAFFSNVKSKGKSVYTINVHNYGSEETYFSDSIVSQESNKIVFLDGFGRKQTITSPGISVTQY